jgi:hypothetical protein
MAEIMLEYFKSDEFYPADRVVTILGKNRYQEVMPELWKNIGENISVIQVNADMMPTDVRFNAVSGADAFASKTMLNSMIANLFQGLGQVGPEIQSVISENFNFSALWEHMLNVSGLDIERLQYTPEEKKERQQRVAQAAQQQQQSMMEQQQLSMQIQQSMEQFKHMLDVEKERYKQQYRAESQTVIDKLKIDEQKEAELEQIVRKIMTQMKADESLAAQKHTQTVEQMVIEGNIERQKGVENVSPSGGRNIQIEKIGEREQ